MTDPKQIVRDGYDAASLAYRGDDGVSPYPYESYLAELRPLIAWFKRRRPPSRFDLWEARVP